MATREEIRGWLENELDIHVAFKYSKQETAKDILTYLHSQGVVIKGDSESQTPTYTKLIPLIDEPIDKSCEENNMAVEPLIRGNYE